MVLDVAPSCGDKLQRLVDVAEEAAVVEVAVAVAEVLLEEGLVVAFLEVVEPARRPLIVTTAWPTRARRHAGGAEQLAADQLREVAGVLHRVREVELVHAVKELVVRRTCPC